MTFKQSEINDDMLSRCEQQSKRHVKEKSEHLINMEEWRAVAQTLDPIETILKVYNQDFRGRDWVVHRDKDDVVPFFKPSKIPLLDELIARTDKKGIPLINEFRGYENLGAELILKKVFKETKDVNVLSELKKRYDERQVTIWNSELKRLKDSPIQSSFDELELYKRCRGFPRFGGGDYPSPVQCAMGVDFTEKHCKIETYTPPQESPFEKDFLTALKQHYP